jgi:RecA-family ATPase
MAGVSMSTPAEILREHGIDYVATTKGTFTAKCPTYNGGYLNVKIERTRVCWYCHSCQQGGAADYEQREASGLGPIKAVFDYTDETGERLYQVLKFEPLNAPKAFRQRTGPDQKKWSIKGVRIVPYRLPELIEDLAAERVIFVVEGEKDVNTLRKHGVPATCNPMGAGKWWPEFNDILRDANIVICGDNDPPGREHVALVANNLHAAGCRLRVLDLASVWPDIEESDDISDWFKASGTVERLWEIVEQIAEWKPKGGNGEAPPWEAGEVPKDDGRALPPLPYVNMANWDSEPVPEQQWTVFNRIPRRQVALFSGEGSAGKSTIELHRTAAHVLGRDWLGTMPEQGPALFIDAEDDQGVIHRRLAAVTNHYDVTFADLIKGGLHLISLVGHDAVVATVGRNGKIEPTALYKQILEAAGDIKPITIAIASSANVYAGSEIDRNQVQQFIGMLTKLAIVSNGSVSLLSHPSLTGITNDTGISGNTQWHNAVRARSYLKGIKPENGEERDSDLREIVFKKNNYGPLSESMVLRYTDGLFLPVTGVSSLNQAAQEARADEIFVALLRRFGEGNRNVYDKAGTGYAPAVFAREEEAKGAGITSKAFDAAMRRLFKAGKIWNEPCGKPSRPSYRLGLKT